MVQYSMVRLSLKKKINRIYIASTVPIFIRLQSCINIHTLKQTDFDFCVRESW